ncbi:hypothetical protein LRS74_28560 [Streptomyces sp. LX-29]|uniref:hypothetical protein n=1 Tax=Streptomyces sp. LX-29 TaxID=2900152 RepID=UPI00240D2C14|nr:hypothetical protein [Streptomyces sp. LX-29]WFB10542.1 hypothetical protein LRS74_28560 [Streptomyces sp. LX-29]
MPATHVVCASGRVVALSVALPGVTFDSLHPEACGEAPDEVDGADGAVVANAGMVLAASVSAAHATIAPRRPRVLINFCTLVPFA